MSSLASVDSVTKNKRRKCSAPSHQKQDILMTLPPEIRNHIYEYVIKDSKREFRASTPVVAKPGRLWTPGILQVSRAIRKETFLMYYSGETFLIILPAKEIERAGTWLSSINATSEWIAPDKYAGDKPGSFVPFSVVFRILIQTWSDMEYMLPLAALAYIAGPALFHDLEDQFTTMSKPMVEACREIIMLGLQAREANDGPAVVQDNFNMWLARLQDLNRDRGQDCTMLFSQIRKARESQEAWIKAGRTPLAKQCEHPVLTRRKNRRRWNQVAGSNSILPDR